MKEVSASVIFLAAWSVVVAQPPSEVIEPEATVIAMSSVDAIVLPGIEIRPVVANTVRIQRLEISEGATSPRHNHADEELFLLVEGQVRAVGGEETFIMAPGDVFIVPPFVAHQLEAIVDSVLIEVGGPGPILGLLRARSQ
jgi:quercetin dioxygenase-like cupin family protein